ncbi:MAG TPA: hypothetical protein VKT75_12150 [Acidobacteriaceae bacterium]|nr:hypothetical protein [Acidobacteriaceae bacterium]
MPNPATMYGVQSHRRAATPEEFSRICAITTIAWLPAWLAAAAISRSLHYAVHGWGTLLHSAALLLATLGAGATGLAAAWEGLREKPSIGFVRVLLHAAVGWAFLPGLAVLARTHPHWSAPVVVMTAAITAASLRQLAAEEMADPDAQAWRRVDLPSFCAPELHERQMATVRPVRAFVMALCAWAALLFAIDRDDFGADAALAAGTFLLLWYWFRESDVVLPERRQMRWLGGTAVAAWLICLVLLLPWLLRGAGGDALTANAAARRAGTGMPVPHHFTSVILWPPREQVTRLYFPTRALSPRDPAERHTPTEIPFDGPYWYFEPPDLAPDALAHVAHGRPTDAGVNLTSADGGPLRMQALEHLEKPIDLACCAELDVAVRDADAQAGGISLGVVLTDTAAHGEPTVVLGFQPVASSGASLRTPQDETVRFSLERARGLRRFDQITVVILPSQQFWRGARVAIEGFTLEPK